MQRITNLLAGVSAGLLGAWVVAFLATVQVTLSNHYIAYGFLRSLLLIFHDTLRLLLLPVLGTAMVITLITWFHSHHRDRTFPFLWRLLGGGCGLAFFLRVGYFHNRHRLAHCWGQQRDLGVVRLPEALFQAEMWRTNVIITLGALAIAIGVWLILRHTLGRRPSMMLPFWQWLGHPLTVLLALALVAIPTMLMPLLRQRTANLPNIILVSLDTLRADHLGAYGYGRDTSPELDRLATNSHLFEWAIAPAPNTPPSHMSIFTSLYPTVHGFTGSSDRLAGWRLTLAEHLREAGYRTLATTDGGFMRGWFGFDQGFERYDDQNKGIAASVRLIFDWIDRGIADPRFFIFLHCYDVHSPYDPPLPYRDRYTDPDYAGGFYPGSQELERIRKTINENPQAGHGLTPEDIAFIRDRYDGGIRYTDYWMGRLIDGLDSRGLLENTWLFVTSDHGEEFTEHGSVLHEKLYHTVTRVPLIVRAPRSRPTGIGKPGSPEAGNPETGSLAARNRAAGNPGTSGPTAGNPAADRQDRRYFKGGGRRIREIVELTDLLPTILDIIGSRRVGEIQGQSLMGLIDGRGDDWKNVAFSEHPWHGKCRALTTPSMQIITSIGGQEIEVYDYHRDPLQQHPIKQAQWPDGTAQQVRLLLDWSAEQILAAAGQASSTHNLVMDDETKRELRALGYIE